jgi:hypothetical protein
VINVQDSDSEEETFSSEDLFGLVYSEETDDQPEIYIDSISSLGVMTIKFTHNMFIVPDYEFNIDTSVLAISLLSDYEMYDPEAMLLDWEVISMSGSKLKIQL